MIGHIIFKTFPGGNTTGPPYGGATPSRTHPQQSLRPCVGARPRCYVSNPQFGHYQLFAQIDAYDAENNKLFPNRQSAYRWYHSTETLVS
jgi:hypothetical protein